MMKRADTTLRLTLAALGTVALLGAAAAAGVDRNTEMMSVGISPDYMLSDQVQTDYIQTGQIQAGAALTDGFAAARNPDRVD